VSSERAWTSLDECSFAAASVARLWGVAAAAACTQTHCTQGDGVHSAAAEACCCAGLLTPPACLPVGCLPCRDVPVGTELLLNYGGEPFFGPLGHYTRQFNALRGRQLKIQVPDGCATRLPVPACCMLACACAPLCKVQRGCRGRRGLQCDERAARAAVR